MQVEAGGNAEAGFEAESVRAVVQLDQEVRLGIRQRVQHHAMHDGEDRRVCGNCERERQQ